MIEIPHGAALAGAVLLGAALSSSAAAQTETLSCTAPERPAELRKLEQFDDFGAKARAYHECLNTYAQAQQAIAKRHEQAARVARQTWQNYSSDVPLAPCLPPAKPTGFDTQAARQAHLRRVQAYRGCIEDFAQAQQAQAKRFSDAANAAMVRWNRYATEAGKQAPQQ